jgi:lysozyme
MRWQNRIVALGGLLVLTAVSRADNAAGEWKPLVDDYSRAQLFKENIKAHAPAPSPGEASKALDGPFTFPKNADFDGGKPRKDSIFGIDISHWASVDPACKRPLDAAKEIQFSTLSDQHVRFVYVKATQGVGFKDCRFLDYWNAIGALPAKKRPLRGSYHFLSSDSSGLDQAKSFVRFREQNGGFDKRELPPTLDLEWDKTKTVPDRWVTKTPQVIVQSALDWLQYVEAHSGKRPMLYTSNEWLKERKIPKDLLAKLKKFRVWIADYSQTRRAIEKPSQPEGFQWTLWQFTDDSQLSIGATQGLDASVFKGTESEFADIVGSGSK